MLITKRTYTKIYVIFSSNVAKQLASAALQAGNTAAKDIGMKATDVSKTVAIDGGKK